MKGWDIKSIKSLHSCDAGEYSVLTNYADDYYTEDYSEYSPNPYIDQNDDIDLISAIYLHSFD